MKNSHYFGHWDPINPFKTDLSSCKTGKSLGSRVWFSFFKKSDLRAVVYSKSLPVLPPLMSSWRAKDGKPEIDFESDASDFRLPEIQIEELKKGLRNSGSLKAEQNIPDMHYSLRVSGEKVYIHLCNHDKQRGQWRFYVWTAIIHHFSHDLWLKWLNNLPTVSV